VQTVTGHTGQGLTVDVVVAVREVVVEITETFSSKLQVLEILSKTAARFE
jgi:hypothetical protein